MSRNSAALSDEKVEELSEIFKTVDQDGNGFINVAELQEVLQQCEIKLPQHKIRELVEENDSKIKDGKIEFEEFQSLFAQLKRQYDFGSRFGKRFLHAQSGIESFEGQNYDTTHSIRREERVSFSNWINRNLADDPDCQRYLPLEPESRDLYSKCSDGILLCKMINKSQPDTIDERTINKGKISVFQMHENLTLALTSAQSIGCNIVNIGPEDLHQGKPHLVLGLLWQIIRIGLLSDINLAENPNLAALLQEGETLEDLMKLTPEQLLIRWVNYHLANSGCGRQITNFQSDIKDSVAYIHLLHQIAPRDAGVSTLAENEPDLTDRAELMLQEADKIQCRSFVAPEDVVSGNYKLNLAFVANLFNNHPGLDKVEDIEGLESIVEETREEKMYRNWMNSMGVSPFVNHLYSDLTNGLIIFQLYDIIKPGVVDWKKVVKKSKPMNARFEAIQNCNYAVELGREVKFSLVGIGGSDIYDGNQTLTLALVWQLMKAYTISVLTKLSQSTHRIVDAEIVQWANEKLASSGKKTSIQSFQDPCISDAKVVIDLVDAIKPRSINYDMVKAGSTDQEKLDNAKYAISMCRKIGARVYALPEDIVEVNSKMVMTIFACLMTKDFQAKEIATK